MFGALGIFQAMVQALNRVLGTSADDHDDDTLMGYCKTSIKSIQRGVIVMAADAEVTASIASVDITKSSINFLGFSGVYDNYQHVSTIFPKLVLTDSTTVTATRHAQYTGDSVSVSFEVIEYY